MDLGDGRAALDAEAVRALARQPEDANGHVVLAAFAGDHLMWIAGNSYPLERSFGTGAHAEWARREDEAGAWLEEGVTYGTGSA